MQIGLRRSRRNSSFARTVSLVIWAATIKIWAYLRLNVSTWVGMDWTISSLMVVKSLVFVATLIIRSRQVVVVRSTTNTSSRCDTSSQTILQHKSSRSSLWKAETTMIISGTTVRLI